jgi:hypothetical protein
MGDPIKTEEVAKAAAGLSQEQLASLIQSIAVMAARQDAGPIPQISAAKAVYRTPWNPTGNKKRPKLKRTTYLSGARLRDALLSDREILLLNKLTAGKYHGGQWVVLEKDEAQGAEVSLFVPNKTQEQRIELKGAARNLEDLLTQIVNEQEGRPALA